MKYIRYDTDRIIRSADCREIARQLGIPVKGKFCQCVSGLHSETQFNHCAIYSDHIHCFSCGDNRNVIGMVQGWYQNILSQSLNFGEACRIVGDLLGGAENFSDVKEQSEKVVLLTSSELQAIGLLPNVGSFPISALYNNNKAEYIKMVSGSAEEQLAKVITLGRKVPRNSPLFTELEGRVNTIKEILIKIGKM